MMTKTNLGSLCVVDSGSGLPLYGDSDGDWAVQWSHNIRKIPTVPCRHLYLRGEACGRPWGLLSLWGCLVPIIWATTMDEMTPLLQAGLL